MMHCLGVDENNNSGAKNMTTTFANITYTHIGASHRRFGCTIQRAVGAGEARYLVIRNGSVVGISGGGEGAMNMARGFAS